MVLEFLRWLQNTPFIDSITSSTNLSSTVWLLHYLGTFLLFGTIVFVDLRVLGLAGRRQSAAQLAGQLLPWMWWGLALAVSSGFLIFAGYPAQYFLATVFRIKLWLFLFAVASGVIVQRNVPRWDRLPAMPAGAKLVALVSLLLWIGTMIASVEVPNYVAISPGS